MRKINKIRYINPNTFESHLRTHFLKITARLYPQAFEELSKQAQLWFGNAFVIEEAVPLTISYTPN
jgi:hypothetical protein